MYNVVMVMTWLMYEHIPISSTLAKFLWKQQKKNRNALSVLSEASSNSVCFSIQSIITEKRISISETLPKGLHVLKCLFLSQ